MTKNKITAANKEMLRLLAANGDQYSAKSFHAGNNCAALCKKGLAEFLGHKKGYRLFAITEAGRIAIEQDHGA
jgi:hypothetical protein